MLHGDIMNSNIIVFTTPTCGWCRKIKEYLKTHGHTFKEIDVSKDPAAAQDMIRKSGQMGVPQLWINNVPVVGFDREKIDRLLSMH